MQMNISDTPEALLSNLLTQIGQTVRIQILLAIGRREACVCHLAARWGYRQASSSQHLMNRRKHGLGITSREGRHIYYKVADPEILTLLELAAKVAGISEETYRHLTQEAEPVPGCPCPHCNPGQPSEFV